MKSLLGLAVLSTALPASGVAEPAPKRALRSTRGGRLLLDIRINGTPVEALLDSGAEMTLVDLAFARQLRLKSTSTEVARGSGEGVLEAGIVDGVTLEAVDVMLDNRTIAVLDLSDVAARLLGHPLSAILGREIFDAARLRIDIDGGTIETVTDESEPPGVALPLTTEHGIETLPVRVEGGPPVQAAFDLGNGTKVMIGAEYARRVGLLSDGRDVRREHGGGIGGEVERQVIQLASLEIAGRTFHDVPATIDEHANANDANVGISILRHFVITTDFGARTVWLQSRAS